MTKGAMYEREVAAALEQELAKGDLGIIPELAIVRLNPTYFSQYRKKDIIFDVSIEVRRRDEEDPFIIWIWECKNYSHTVPVDDIEEFHSKLEQIGSDRTKGTIVTTIGFSNGTVEYARSQGIGLVRHILPDDTVFILEDKGSFRDVTQGRRFYGLFYGLATNGKFVSSGSELMSEEFLDELVKRNIK